MSLAPYRKAVVSGLMAAGTALLPFLADERLTLAEGATALVAGLVAAGTVYLTPNALTEQQRLSAEGAMLRRLQADGSHVRLVDPTGHAGPVPGSYADPDMDEPPHGGSTRLGG